MRELVGSLVRSIKVCVLVTLLLTTTTGFGGTNRAIQPELRSNPPVAKSRVPAPRDVIGFTPGEDRKLASWATIVDYFKQLERASDRVMFQELGKTTLGRPFVLATISSPRNLAWVEGALAFETTSPEARVIAR